MDPYYYNAPSLGERYRGRSTMPKLDERITALETRLKQMKARQQKLETRRRAIESRRTRKEETRRKILVGTIVLTLVDEGRLPSSELHTWLDEALTRPEDRALFELPARTGT
jgi:hypothetical protein